MKYLNLLLTAVIAATTSSQIFAGSWWPEQVIGGKLETIVYQPTTTPKLGDKRALMISLHGCGQTNDEFQEGANWATQADNYGMVVALPQAAGEGSYGYIGCWNFHVGMNISRNNSDAKYLLDLVESLLNNETLNIDPHQVYLTGLSSGGGMVASMACLAPEVFAGAGVNAGPGPGSTGTSNSSPDISVSQGVSNCKTLANKDGANSQQHLYTQLHSSVCGSADTMVTPAWCDRVSDIMVATYNEDTNISDCSGGDNPTSITGNGTVTTWCDSKSPRASKMIINGMGHAWPAGPGSSGGGQYIDHSYVNYPEYITAFFFNNNRRAITNKVPSINDLTASASGSIISLSGTATDEDGSITSVSVEIKTTNSTTHSETLTLSVNEAGYFSGNSSSLADANYTVTAIATDDKGLPSPPSSTSLWIGEIPPNSAPIISNITTATQGACVTVTGDIVDVDNNLSKASADFDNGTIVNISVTNQSNQSFSIEQCSLPYGNHTVTITAEDSEQAKNTSEPYSFATVDLGKTGNISYHLDEGTITYGEGYSWCYTEYGSSTEFTMNQSETSSGNCRWTDAAGAQNCQGPEFSCTNNNNDADNDGITDSNDNCPNVANSDQTDDDNDGIGNACDDNQSTCTEQTTYNYYHKTAGRAYSTGSTISPDYFANGSDDPMPGSTWGNTTLHSTDDGSNWQIGSCN